MCFIDIAPDTPELHLGTLSQGAMHLRTLGRDRSASLHSQTFPAGGLAMLMKPVHVAAAQIDPEIPVRGHLAGHDKFGEMIQRLDIQAKVTHYDKGAEIFWEESATDYVYQLTSGAVRN